MAEEKKRVTRRRFGKAVAQAGAAAAAPMLVAGAALGQSARPASSAPVRSGPAAGPVVVGNYAMVDRIRVGGIGIGGRGMSDLGQMLGDERVQLREGVGGERDRRADPVHGFLTAKTRSRRSARS